MGSGVFLPWPDQWAETDILRDITYLKSVSSQCAPGKSFIARKPEVYPNSFKRSKTFKKSNPPDFKFYPSELTNKNFPHVL